MKALPFLDLINAFFFAPEPVGIQTIAAVRPKISDLQLLQILNFYSRPFEPGKHHELFQSIYCSSDMVGECWYSTERTDAFSISFEAGKNFVKYNDNDFISLYPLTLNDLLTDCARAEIELQWSEESIREYPFLNPRNYDPTDQHRP